MEKRYIHKQGHTVWINLTVSIVRYEDLKTKKQIPQYFISVIEDISKRKLIEQELESSNDELERFAYAASHDLQEPLRKISMFSASLQESLKEKIQDEKALYELDRIGDAALRMKSMVSSLMELSRAQRLEVRREVVSLETLVMQTKEQLETLIDETGASVELIRDNVSLFVDRVAMLHVLQNLISNAIRYCPITRAPRIEINANDSESGTEIELRIKDNAMGIAPELQNAAFEPFRRLVGKEIKGSGMGLSICKRIVERHGAQLSIESSNDTGTTFLICLPKS
jgi:light-regulated signal transduction histidine kinase (bacteriophytochrome)